jgi:hypothetical protein
MINALARLGDRLLRGVLPEAEAQACAYTGNGCRDRTVLSSGWYACCTNTCGHSVCTLDDYGTLMGCAILSC